MSKDQEVCEKTGLKRVSCYHCKTTPEYEMVESNYNGSPVVEVLHRGGSIHEFDKHFRFGKSKARLFLACMDIVEEVAATPYGEMPAIKSQKVVDSVNGNLISVQVESFRGMKLSSGRTINVPWVRLQSDNNPKVRIGFGREKAKAILKLRKELAEWADSPLIDE